MALPRVPIRALAPGEQILPPDAEAHLVRVLRLADGDPFVAFDPARGLEGTARIVRAKKGAVVARVEELRPVPATRTIVWVHGLAKADKCDAVVRDATELGATMIVIARTARSVPPSSTAEARAPRWTKIADEAARQSGRAKAPEVRVARDWKDALAVAGEEAGPSSRALFVLYEGATDPLGPRLARASGALVFAAGPEGGLEKREVDEAIALGFVPVSIGDRILRTETVPAAVLGAALILSTTEH